MDKTNAVLMLVFMIVLLISTSSCIHYHNLLSCDSAEMKTCDPDKKMCSSPSDFGYVMSVLMLIFAILGLLYSGYNMYNVYGGASQVAAGRDMLNAMRARRSMYGRY